MRKDPLNPKYIRVDVSIGLIIREVIRTGQTLGTGDNIQVVGPDKTIETIIFEETLEGMEDKIIEKDIEMIGIMIIMEAETDQERRHLQEIMCREYDHFMRYCPSFREERDLEQLQQMLNMEEQTRRQESPEENYRSPLNV